MPSSPSENNSNNNKHQEPSATTAAEATATTGVLRQRKPRKKRTTPSQQQRMLMQMKAQQALEDEQGQVVQAYAGGAFLDQWGKFLRTMLLILFVGGINLYLFPPPFLRKWWRPKPSLPPRSLITVYPPHVNIKRDLPRFFHEYSLATIDNAPARQAMRHVVQTLRPMATNEGSRFAQKISLWPWDVTQFRHQLANRDALDQYCGAGTDVLYQTRPELHADIVLWCLLGTAHDHGFVRYEVQNVYGSLARGIKGVAVRYDGHANRAMARSLLLLPFHRVKDLKKNQPLPPSTKVATRTLAWLRQNAPLIADEEELYIAMEEYLYYIIAQEEAKWHWLAAACTAVEREARQDDPRVASMCTKEQEAAGEDCSVIYDPLMHEFFGRKAKPRRRVAEEAEDDDDDE